MPLSHLSSAEILMVKLPQFSVVVPVYNKRAYIKRAVVSVLTQTLTNFELIVVDDGSTDGSIEALADTDDTRLRIIQQQNQGVGSARNTGMLSARGTWIAFLDADDEWLDFHLFELDRIAGNYPDSGLISTSCMETTGALIPILVANKKLPIIRKVDYFFEASRKIGFINSTSCAVHRVVFEELGGFTTASSGEDLEYWARIALVYQVAISERLTCIYYRNNDGTMLQKAKRPNQTPKNIQNLREISPSVAMLCDHDNRNCLFLKNPSIRLYVNGRLESCIKGALYRGDTIAARNFGELMQLPLTLKQQFICFLVNIPESLLIVLLRVYKYLK
jgi:glycosyltransferase involved in cell wall biosynthesis